MDDRVLGGVLLVGSVAVGVFYLWWLFLSPWGWWAVAVPILLAVAGFLFIVGWIGWTMATTPSPAAIEETILEEPPETEAEEKPVEEAKKKPTPRRRTKRRRTR